MIPPLFPSSHAGICPSRRVTMAQYQCSACYFPYDEAEGLPEHGIPAGTRWADVPADFVCPDCGTPKSNWMELNTD